MAFIPSRLSLVDHGFLILCCLILLLLEDLLHLGLGCFETLRAHQFVVLVLGCDYVSESPKSNVEYNLLLASTMRFS